MLYERMLILERSIEQDLVVIGRLFVELAAAKIDRATPQEERIVAGYRLHRLYNAFESIFRDISHAFENLPEEEAGWQRELLRRMRLDLMPIRPPLLDADTFDKLDELRRFRHLFRSLYTSELDPLRMTVALAKAQELRKIWPGRIAAFLGSVGKLRSASAPGESID